MTAHDQPFRSPEREELLAAVARIAGLLDGAAFEAEQRRDLPPACVTALREAGLLKYAAPRFVGGLEVDPITNSEIAEALSRIDLTAAWLAVQQGTSVSIMSKAAPDAVYEEVFGGTHIPILAGSITPRPGAFRATRGGYIVNGRWPFLSGVSHAEWVTLSGTSAEPGADPALVIGAAVPKSKIIQEDNWHVAGMKGSGSYDVAAQDLFVPAHRTWEFKLPPTVYRDAGGRRSYPPHMNGCAMALGGAQRVIDEVITQALAKKRPGSTETVAHRPYFQHFIGESELKLRAARAGFYEIVEQLWRLERLGEPFPPELMARLTATPAFVYSLASDLATQALRFIGSSAARLENPLQRYLRDLSVMSLHVQCGEQYLETLGQSMLGLEMIVPGGSNTIGTGARVAAGKLATGTA
jgi:indole-3-acetate monooxygenase